MHKIIRWALGMDGVFHMVEFALNLFEGAYLSATFTLLTGLLMLGGAFINYSHHPPSTKDEEQENSDA